MAQNLLKEVCQYLGEPAAEISIHRIPVPDYRDFLKKEMEAVVFKATFRGMRGQKQKNSMRPSDRKSSSGLA